MTVATNPFTGYVRSPEGAPTQADLDAAISSASAKYKVPTDVLRRIWQQETGGQVNAAQVVGYNSSGYGGLFGLPKNLLGSISEQADHAASLLSGYGLPSWDAAVRKYSGGAYGFAGNPDTVAPKQCPPGSKLMPDGLCHMAGGFGPPVDFLPSLPTPTPGAEAPQVRDVVTNVQKALTTPGELIAFLTDSRNWWRAAFVIGGAILVIAGARLYIAPSKETVHAE